MRIFGVRNRREAYRYPSRVSLPETQLSGLVLFLETIVAPIDLRKAPLDNELETDEEQAAVVQARQWLQNNGGNGIAHSEAMRRLDIE